MVVSRAAENVFGTIGTVCWTVQVMPQIYKSYRTKSTKGLSEWLLLLWALSGPFLGVYVVVQDLNIPLIIQPQLFATLAAVSWAQCLHYGTGRPRNTCIILLLSILVLMGGFEVGMIYAVRPAFQKGNIMPVQFFGVFSSVMIFLGFLPQYWEIYQHKEAVGISMLFIFIDWLGGLFSVLSLVFKEEFDIIAGITYSLVVVMDGFIILAYFILNPAAKRRREREEQEESGETSETSTAVVTAPVMVQPSRSSVVV